MTDRYSGSKENSEDLFAEQSTHDYDYDLTMLLLLKLHRILCSMQPSLNPYPANVENVVSS
jgi:hypothetical protein